MEIQKPISVSDNVVNNYSEMWESITLKKSFLFSKDFSKVELSKDVDGQQKSDAFPLSSKQLEIFCYAVANSCVEECVIYFHLIDGALTSSKGSEKISTTSGIYKEISE